jgi:pimeloyl-ACP methyl ester carboxylesterase
VSSREGLPIFGTEENRAKLMAIYDEALRQWPVPFETSFVLTRYGKTHVIASGDPASPPLVMTHPAAVGGFVWSSIIDPLSEKHRVYALETIGDFGRSELTDPERYPKKGRDYSAWLDDVYEQLEITQADIVAGSMGGWIAMNHAIYAPDRVRRLVLLGPMGPTLARHARRPRPVRVVCDATDRRQVRANHLPCLGRERARESRVPLLDEADGKGQGEGWATDPHPSPKASDDQGADPGHSRGQGWAGRERRRCREARAEHPELRDRDPPPGGHIMSVDEPEVVGNRIAAFLGHAP